MRFPKASELKRVRKKLERVDGTLALDVNVTPLERFRFDICQRILKYKMKKVLNQKQLAQELRVDEAKVSKILHHRIDEFSTDRLIDLYSRLNPHLILQVS